MMMKQRRLSQCATGLLSATLLFAACGGDDEKKATPTTKERTAAALPARGSVEPGTYITRTFRPEVTLTVGDGWTVAFPEEADNFFIVRGFDPTSPNPEAWQSLTFSRISEIFDSFFLRDPIDKRGHTRPAPDDLAGWLRENPYLETSEPIRVTVGGVDGVQLDATVKPLPLDQAQGTCATASRRCIVLFNLENPDAYYAQLEGTTNRYIVLKVRGASVLVNISPSEEGEPLADFLPLAEEVLATVDFG
jgi:hypothetical protein